MHRLKYILLPILLCAAGAHAQTTSWVTGITNTTTNNTFTGCSGVSFTAVSATVTYLGRYKVAGNTQTHSLYLLDSSLAVKATVNVNMAGTAAADGFVYGAVTPAALTPTATYYLMSCETSGGDAYYTGTTYTWNTALAIAGLDHYYVGSPPPTSSTSAGGSAGSVDDPVNFLTGGGSVIMVPRRR